MELQKDKTTKNGRPPCANKNCKSGYGGITGINGLFYCGECAVKVMEIKQAIENKAIQEALNNG